MITYIEADSEPGVLPALTHVRRRVEFWQHSDSPLQCKVYHVSDVFLRVHLMTKYGILTELKV